MSYNPTFRAAVYDNATTKFQHLLNSILRTQKCTPKVYINGVVPFFFGGVHGARLDQPTTSLAVRELVDIATKLEGLDIAGSEELLERLMKTSKGLSKS